jgi:hypothetical protein
MLEKALSGSRTYWAWIFSLLVIIGVGAACWYWQLTEGLTITGLSRDVVWGFYIAQFTFLVGVAASAVMVVLPYYLHNYKAFGKITILGEFLAIGAVIMHALHLRRHGHADPDPERLPLPDSDLDDVLGRRRPRRLPGAEHRDQPGDARRRAARRPAAGLDHAGHRPLHPVGDQHPHRHRRSSTPASPPGRSG